MLKAYKGRYENETFILSDYDKALIPNNVNVIITILDDLPVSEPHDSREQKRIAAINFLSAIQHINKICSGDDDSTLDELRAGNYKPVFEERL